MLWNKLFHFGDIELTVALAAAMSAWLVVARAWRLALWWSLLFLLGIGLVAASKVAFMAWGVPMPGVDFKAISGHATGVTAVFPILLHLLLHGYGPRVRIGAVVAGLVLGAMMAVLLVVQDQHSVAEALAGWVTGAAVSLGAIRMAGALPPGGTRPQGLLCATLVFASAAWAMQAVPHRYLMSRTALFISGNAAPVSWCVGGYNPP